MQIEGLMQIAPDELQGTAPPSRARPRAVALGPALPHQLLTLPGDYAALPVAGMPRVAKRETVAFKNTSSTVSVVMTPGLVAEIEVVPQRFYLDMPGNGFGAAGASSLGAGVSYPCVRRSESVSVRWRGFAPASMKPGSLLFSELRGELDPVTCVVDASTRLDVRAEALIPKTLYAFRRCDSHCDPGLESERLETLTLVAPPSSFVLASDARPDEMTNPHVGTFTIVEVPVAPDRAASGTIRLPIGAFERLPRSAPGASPRLLGASGLEVDVEVVGPTAGGDPPSLALHVSALVEPQLRTGTPAPLNPGRLRGFNAP
jgi:hypothetical protein